MSSFREDFAKVRLYRKVERINAKIAKLGVRRKAIQKKQLKLTNKRERLLGQELT